MEMFQPVAGGVCAAKGFSAAGVHCGIRRNHSKLDLALIKADVRCAGAGCYTTNKVYGAPITVDREHLQDGYAQAILVNSGNANTCAPNGIQLAKDTCDLVAKALGIDAQDVLPSSTGVIGQAMELAPFEKGIPEAAAKLAATPEGSHDAATAIMTTDTHSKEYAVAFTIGGKTCHIGAMAKGSGMIHPNMATMLAYITTDAKVDAAVVQEMLKKSTDKSFNMMTVDGDTSTNDSLFLLANGASGVAVETEEDKAAFAAALDDICMDMARRIASDGEGATHLIIVEAGGLPTEKDAKMVARSIAGSTLFKAAVFGKDANWGRIMAAAGYSGADVDPTKADCILKSAAGEVVVMENGFGTDFSEELAKKVLTEHDITVIVNFHSGDGQATAFGCDLTYDYVKINGDYRS